jgi:hypothetical protein
LVGIVEEIGKLAIVAWFIWRDKGICHPVNGLLIGATVGAGFAAIESAGYAFRFFLGTYSYSEMMDVIILRAALAPGGHVIWAAMSGYAVMISKGAAPLNMNFLSKTSFWKLFLVPVVLHSIWDMPIKFGADIESENGFDVYHEAVIDLAGYDLNVTGEYQSTFWIVADNVEVLDSVGGSAFYKQIMSNGGKLKISGSIEFYTDNPACIGNGDIDLSGYTGEEIYISCHGNLTIPEGYSYYDALGNKVENPSDGDLIYVRKDSTDTPAS